MGTTVTTQIDGSTGLPTEQKSSNGAAHVVDQHARVGGIYNSDGTYPKSEVCSASNTHFNDIPDYTDHATQGVLAAGAAELATQTYTAGEYVTAVLVNAGFGGADFKGVYVCLNAASNDDARAALRSQEGVATPRYFVKVGTTRLLKLKTLITRVDMTAIDNGATPDNNIELEPF